MYVLHVVLFNIQCVQSVCEPLLYLVCNLLDTFSPNKNKYHSTADTYDYSTDYFNDPYNCRDLNPTQVPCTCEQ